MKKSNIIITAVAAIASIFLLWLWYFLGFNEVDSPTDLVVSVAWWAVVIGGAALVAVDAGPDVFHGRTAQPDTGSRLPA